MLNVKEINEGRKILYTVDEEARTITLNEELVINLAEEQTDIEVLIDVSLNRDGQLMRGVDTWYVAHISIPPAEYDLFDTGERNEQDQPILEQIKLPLFVENVTLTLWALPEGTEEPENIENGGEE